MIVDSSTSIPQLNLLRCILDLPTGPGVLVDLAVEARSWIAERWRGELEPNPLLDPGICEEFVSWVHKRHGARWSFGGYLEDRTELWRGSYLDPAGSAIHAAIDVNVPAGTPVRTGVFGKVVLADSDAPLVGGWGSHVIIEPNDFPFVFLFGHLGPDLPSVGENTSPDTLIGSIGASPDNGVWFAHLHFQAVEREQFYNRYHGSTKTMDGYFRREDEAIYRKIFPEPMRLLEDCRTKQGLS
jgi:murein DD-endopeptidase MepM/ murein hydrolase activator NlpD